MGECDELAVDIPEWVESLGVHRHERKWVAFVIGDANGTGISKSTSGEGATPTVAVNAAFDKAEGWVSFTLKKEEEVVGY